MNHRPPAGSIVVLTRESGMAAQPGALAVVRDNLSNTDNTVTVRWLESTQNDGKYPFADFRYAFPSEVARAAKIFHDESERILRWTPKEPIKIGDYVRNTHGARGKVIHLFTTSEERALVIWDSGDDSSWSVSKLKKDCNCV